MDLQVQIKALKYLLRLMNGEIDKMPHAKYTPQKEKYYIRAANTAFFNRVPPASQGVPAEQVEALFRGLAGERGVNAHSLLLLRHGHVIAEGYWSPYRPDYTGVAVVEGSNRISCVFTSLVGHFEKDTLLGIH